MFCSPTCVMVKAEDSGLQLILCHRCDGYAAVADEGSQKTVISPRSHGCAVAVVEDSVTETGVLPCRSRAMARNEDSRLQVGLLLRSWSYVAAAKEGQGLR